MVSFSKMGRTRNEQGQAMVEFVLVIPILLVVLFATIQLGTVFFHYQQLSAATSEGARRAIVSRNSADPQGDTIAAVQNAAPALDNGLTVAVDSTWDAGDPVTVTATYPAEVRIMGITLHSGVIESQRTMRVEQ